MTHFQVGEFPGLMVLELFEDIQEKEMAFFVIVVSMFSTYNYIFKAI